MFYYIKNVEKSISLCPKDIGMKITEIITERVEDSGEGVIDDNGNIVFCVKYSALTFKPVENEVMDGVVKEIMNNGFNVYVGPMQVFISKSNIPPELVYSDSPEKQFSDKKNKIKDGSVIRFRLKSTIFKGNNLYGIGTIADDYLGIFSN